MVYYKIEENFSDTNKQTNFENSGRILDLNIDTHIKKNQEKYIKIRNENLEKINKFNKDVNDEISTRFGHLSKKNVTEEDRLIHRPIMCELIEKKHQANTELEKYNQDNKIQINSMQQKNNELLDQEQKHNESLKLLELAIEQKEILNHFKIKKKILII